MRPIHLLLGIQSRLERASIDIFRAILILVRGFIANQFVLASENLALRYQLIALDR
jgi:hypothetical protein